MIHRRRMIRNSRRLDTSSTNYHGSIPTNRGECRSCRPLTDSSAVSRTSKRSSRDQTAAPCRKALLPLLLLRLSSVQMYR